MQRREWITGLAAGSLAALPAAASGRAQNDTSWKAILAERLPLYGHRNWIVVADSAYPAQARPAIETVVSHADHLQVIRAVWAMLSESKHVRPVIYQDQELQFVPEQDAAGADMYRHEIATIFNDAKVNILPHEQIIHKLDQTAQTFDVLVIKTNFTIPYTSVFFELACAYWPDDAEKRLRTKMAGRH